MISHVEGDILLTTASTIAHGVAPNDDFKQGLALALRERWPDMYKDFRHYCQTQNPKPGSLWTWHGAGGFTCINLLTQEPAQSHGSHPGKAKLENVNHCLHDLVKEIKRLEIKSLAMPRLATGVGGLEWKDVEPLMKKSLDQAGIPVFVYTRYLKGQKANEM